MLEYLRKSAGGTVAKVFIGLLVVSFAVWGIGDVFRGFGSRDLAQVGSIRIDIEEFRQMYQERLQQLSRRLGRGISPDQARALGLDRQLLGEIISEATLDEKARQLGLNIGNDTLLAHIHSNPAFRGPNGQFDAGRFYEALRAAGFSEARYLDSERRLILRQQLGRALGGDIKAPETAQNALRRYDNEERAIEYVVLGRNDAGEIPAPSPSEIDAYFERNKTAFRAPEYRKLVVIALTPETLAASTEISDAEVRKVFEERRERLGTPERREIEQIVFPNAAEAQAAADRIAGGAKFEDIVKQRELKPSDVSLGLVAKRDVLDRAVADAVFGLSPGEVSKPLASRFGSVLARVTRIVPGKEPAFADVADAIRKELALSRARNTMLDQHDRIEDERAAGAKLAEVAAKLKLKAMTIDAVDRSGRDPGGKSVENVPALRDVVSSAFATDVGVETDPVTIDEGQGYVWYEVLGVTPSRDRTLEEIRDRVGARWRDEQITKRLAERTDAIRAKLDAGQGFAAAAPGSKIETRDRLRRGRAAEGLDRAALSAMFETPQGRTGVATTDDVGRIVFRVTSVDLPADSSVEARRMAELGAGFQDDLLVQYVLHLQNELGVRVNETAFRSLTGGPGN